MIEWAPVRSSTLWAHRPRAQACADRHSWDDQRHPINLPATKELRFEPGTTIGGIVQDEAGHPIEGATVNVHAPPTETDRPNSVFSLGSVKTDAEGRWRWTSRPRIWQSFGRMSHIPIIEAMACLCRATSTPWLFLKRG